MTYAEHVEYISTSSPQPRQPRETGQVARIAISSVTIGAGQLAGTESSRLPRVVAGT
jgi:hypothetical protein